MWEDHPNICSQDSTQILDNLIYSFNAGAYVVQVRFVGILKKNIENAGWSADNVRTTVREMGETTLFDGNGLFFVQ